MEISKSTRHSKITGDFAEALVLYWLSRDAFECARIDHTGIDLLARNRHTDELMGISVKSRSRYTKTADDSVSINTEEFDKAEKACRTFRSIPYFAIVVDTGSEIKLFLISLENLKQVAKHGKAKVHWGMKAEHLEKYAARADLIKSVTLKITSTNWWHIESKAPTSGNE